MKKALIVIANSGFQDTEFSVPYEYLKENEVQLTIAAGQKGDCIGVFGKKVFAEISIATADTNNYDMIIFI